MWSTPVTRSRSWGSRPTQKTTCTGVEMFRKLLDEGQAGDNIGALLRGTKKEEVERGQVLCKPGRITPHTDFEGQVYVLTKEEGGRHKPFFANYRPQFYFRTTDVTGHDRRCRRAPRCACRVTTRSMKVELDRPDRHGRGPALRHPRGWPHRRRRPRHQDHQVGEQPMAKANEKRIAVTLECTAVQAPQLHHQEEQGERPRAHRDEEVLPVGAHPHAPQGDPVAVGRNRAAPPSGSEPSQ